MKKLTVILVILELFLLCKLASTQPEILWERYFGGNQNEEGIKAIEAGDGGIIVIGTSESFGKDRIASVASTEDNSFLLCGSSDSHLPNDRMDDDLWLIKTGQIETGVRDRYETTHPSQLSLSAFPSPFNSTTTVRIVSPLSVAIRATLYNMAGMKS